MRTFGLSLPAREDAQQEHEQKGNSDDGEVAPVGANAGRVARRDRGVVPAGVLDLLRHAAVVPPGTYAFGL